MTAPVLIMAGGTGGHIFPALAVAAELRRREVPVVWLGTRQGMEAKLVAQHGYPMEWIQVQGLRGKGVLRLLAAPWMLAQALWQAWRVLRRLRPAAVLGMGGFVTGPGGLAAWMSGRPLLIHEQNSIAGLTNRLLAPLARILMEAFPGALQGRHSAVLTGNPVRADIAALPSPAERMSDTGASRGLRVLALGGSLGAQALNETLPRGLALAALEPKPEVRHQTGANKLADAQRAYADAGVEAELLPFIDDMAAAYAWADVVICRAGALTVAELCAAGVASVLVPYPHAVDDHQTTNAAYLADADAAVLLPQPDFTAERVAALLREWNGARGRLREMAIKARERALPNAAQQVAELCQQAMGTSA